MTRIVKGRKPEPDPLSVQQTAPPFMTPEKAPFIESWSHNISHDPWWPSDDELSSEEEMSPSEPSQAHLWEDRLQQREQQNGAWFLHEPKADEALFSYRQPCESGADSNGLEQQLREDLVERDVAFGMGMNWAGDDGSVCSGSERVGSRQAGSASRGNVLSIEQMSCVTTSELLEASTMPLQ